MDLAQTSDVLAALQALLMLLKRTGGRSGDRLQDYLHCWLPTSHTRNILTTLEFHPFTLGQVVALYEAIEDVLAPAAVEFVGERYRCPLKPEDEAKLIDMITDRLPDAKSGATSWLGSRQKQSGGGRLHAEVNLHASFPWRVVPKALAQGLYRFMYRFLSSEQHDQPEDTPIKLYLADPRCVQWGPGALVGRGGPTGPARGEADVYDYIDEVLPEGVQLKHTFTLYCLARQYMPRE